MRSRRYPIPILLLLACALSVLSKPLDDLGSRVELSKDAVEGTNAAAGGTGKVRRHEETLDESLEKARSYQAQRYQSDPKSNSKDGLYDGADGRPHAGPFVETAADRDRQKAKGKVEEETVPSGRKPGPKDKPSEDPKPGSHDADMPATNDGVMDDPLREVPKEGTRGTEGGVSEKNREDRLDSLSGKQTPKKPSEPKEAPPLPHSEQTKLSESTEKSKSTKSSKVSEGKTEEKSEDKDGSNAKELELGGLKRPDDLPTKPHAIPYPGPNSITKEESLAEDAESPSIDNSALDSGLIQPLHSFGLAFTMIVFSEIGDKTFLVAALMAMKHPALLVLSAAFPALATMTVLSAVLGHALPTLLPVRFTGFLAAILFLAFGAKLLREGYKMKPDEGVGEEMREVEMELEEKEQLARKYRGRNGSTGKAVSAYALEAGRGDTRKSRSNSRLPAPESPPSSPDGRSPSPSAKSSLSGALVGMTNLFSLLFSPVWVQTFAMTFLGEWGDRSQIATIAMAAGQDYWWVTSGALAGHLLCTVIAVLGGRAIAGRVSMRVVTLGGAFAFLAFGVVYLVESMYYS